MAYSDTAEYAIRSVELNAKMGGTMNATGSFNGIEFSGKVAMACKEYGSQHKRITFYVDGKMITRKNLVAMLKK